MMDVSAVVLAQMPARLALFLRAMESMKSMQALAWIAVLVQIPARPVPLKLSKIHSHIMMKARRLQSAGFFYFLQELLPGCLYQ